MPKKYVSTPDSSITEKTCDICRILKPISEYAKNRTQKDGYNGFCNQCASIKNGERYRRIRRVVLDYYGKTCACCGESRVEFLAIDHIAGNGNKERQKLGWTNLYEYLYRNGLPDRERYRVLCHNCNMSFGLYGYCPHNMVTEKVKT